jgi:hypothetical protein
MAAATVNARSITSLGPIKMELIVVSASNTNTVNSRMNTLNFALAFGASASSAAVSTAVSGRQITLHDAGTAQPIMILAFGS